MIKIRTYAIREIRKLSRSNKIIRDERNNQIEIDPDRAKTIPLLEKTA